jgi:hypothetical protein
MPDPTEDEHDDDEATPEEEPEDSEPTSGEEGEDGLGTESGAAGGGQSPPSNPDPSTEGGTGH